MVNKLASLSLLALLFVTGSPLFAQAQEAAAEAPSQELGDFGLLNAHQPLDGVLFGGQPEPGQLEAMARAGFKTVLDLRREVEERGFDEPGYVEELGLEYVSIPVGSETLQVKETYERFTEILENAERPILVHCASGNRVGALYYAWLLEQGEMTRDEALTEARRQGLRSDALAETVDQVFATEP